MVTEKFKKRIVKNRLHREENWFNMGSVKSSSSRLRLIFFAEDECLHGKNVFPHQTGLYWTFFFVPKAKRRLVLQNGASLQLLPTDLYVEKPAVTGTSLTRGEEVLENRSSTPVKRYYFAMERNAYVEQMFHLDELEVIHLRDATAVQDCVMEMAEKVRGRSNSTAEELSVLLFRFLTLITSTRREYGSCAGDYEQKIEVVRRFPQNYPTMKSLESAFKVSAATLRKIFYRFTKKSPIDFVVHARLRNSCWMLTNSEVSIREIAFLNGYSTAGYYAKSFKKVVGISPSQYRQDRKLYFP